MDTNIDTNIDEHNAHLAARMTIAFVAAGAVTAGLIKVNEKLADRRYDRMIKKMNKATQQLSE